MPKLFFNLDQGSAQWYQLRSGIPTSSEFDKIMTPKTQKMSESRHKYAARIIAGRLMNWQADSLDKIQHIQDGKENEPLAIAQLELVNNIETKPIGFVTSNDGRFGSSPDRVVMKGDQIGITVEAKAPTIPIQMERLLFGHDEAYRCQVNGQLLVCEADKALFTSFHPRMPPYSVETGRDEAFIKKLSDALDQFSEELETLMERAVSLGGYQAFAELVAPVDAELGPTAADIERAITDTYAWGA